MLITRDKKIRSRPVERQRLLAAGVRGFVLTAAGDLNTAQMVALVNARWGAMTRYLSVHTSGPRLASVTRSGVTTLFIPGS